MQLFYVLITILIIFVFVSLILNLLLNPFTWVIIGVLVIASMIRRYLYRKQMDEFNKEFKKRTQEKKEYYYQQKTSSNNQTKNEDIIDVNYKIVDEDEE